MITPALVHHTSAPPQTSIWTAFVGCLVAGALAACGPSGNGGAGAPGKGPGGPGSAMQPPEVEVIEATLGSATMTQELPGRLQAVRTAQVRARVEGIIERRLFTEGSDVKEGSPLFRIDPRPYQAAYDAAKAEQAIARITVERYTPLLDVKAISKQEFDLAQAKLKQADAALMRAQIDLENTTVPAPITGRIGRELVTEGALVGRGESTALATIEQIDPIYVNFTQSSADMLRLQKGIKAGRMKSAQKTKIELVMDDNSVYAKSGKLLFTDMAVDPATGSVSMRAEFPNANRELLPGTFVRVRFPEAVVENVILVPQRAVQAGPQGQFVVVVDETNKAVAVPIKTGGMSGLNFVVTEGLKGGERIIVNGLQKARPGTPVRMIMLGPDGKPLPAKAPDAAAPTSSSSSTKETPPATEQTPPANKETPPTPPAKGSAETNVEQKK